jgi:hypothetical protein
MSFEISTFFKVGLCLRFAAEHQIRQAAEIISTRIIRPAFDGLRKLFMRAVVIASEVGMHPVTIILGEDRLIVGRQRDITQRVQRQSTQ